MRKSWFLIPAILLAPMACTKSKNNKEATGTTQAVTSDLSLAKLLVIADQIEPAFDPLVKEYTLAGGETYKNKITVNAAPVDAGLHVEINGVPLRSDFITNPMPLAAGMNIFTIALVNSAGDTVNTYQLKVQRIQELPDETLADLSTSDGELSPPYSPDITAYELLISPGTTVLTVSPLPNYPDESDLEINGVKQGAFKGGYDVNIAPGTSMVTILVKGKSGRNKTFTIQVTRPAS